MLLQGDGAHRTRKLAARLAVRICRLGRRARPHRPESARGAAGAHARRGRRRLAIPTARRATTSSSMPTARRTSISGRRPRAASRNATGLRRSRIGAGSPTSGSTDRLSHTSTRAGCCRISSKRSEAHEASGKRFDHPSNGKNPPTARYTLTIFNDRLTSDSRRSTAWGRMAAPGRGRSVAEHVAIVSRGRKARLHSLLGKDRNPRQSRPSLRL
jgi:hypothetical protein